ncbi:MAG: 2,3-bisphosphoglycerate-independent phosphoglycerate mutase [Sneathiella sp.]
MKNAETPKNRPVLLCILDGWGHREDNTDNAIARGNTPNWDRMVANRPMSLLSTSGADVGLPDGQMGNSEVGHMTIGSGRVVLQDLPRINHAIETGELAKNSNLQDLITKLKQSGGTCHVAGLLSPGGVHSHQNHMLALCQILSDAGIPVALHGYTDGRDTPPGSSIGFVAEAADALGKMKAAKLATLCGRYFAMDRDNNWERVQKAYDAMFSANGTSMINPADAVQLAYDNGENDEFLSPLIAEGYDGVKEGDALLTANFRSDRTRQYLNAVTTPDFTGFDTTPQPKLCAIVGMVEYSSALAPLVPALFPPVDIQNTLGHVVSAAGQRQLRIAETEKYAHVTFFLNGGEEDVFPGEERILIPSPKVATYDLQPEMSAFEVKDNLLNAINGGTFDLIIVNFANPDMVGHTGVMAAAIKAVETMDDCVEDLAHAVENAGGTMLITADHGNIELMRDQTTLKPHTAHTTNLVPFVLAAGDENATLENGSLADIAPTILSLMEIEIPDEMTGKILVTPSVKRPHSRAVS